MYKIKLKPHIESELCVGMSAQFYNDSILKISIGSVGSLDRLLRVIRNSYVQEIYDATILFSSIIVETAMNMDIRMKEFRVIQLNKDIKKNFQNPTDWLRLSSNTLRQAKTKTLPVMKLLDSNESIEDNLIKFIERRNKIAHGDYGNYVTNYKIQSDDGFFALNNAIDIPKEDALDQFQKSSDFIVAWANQNPEIIGLDVKKI